MAMTQTSFSLPIPLSYSPALFLSTRPFGHSFSSAPSCLTKTSFWGDLALGILCLMLPSWKQSSLGYSSHRSRNGTLWIHTPLATQHGTMGHFLHVHMSAASSTILQSKNPCIFQLAPFSYLTFPALFIYPKTKGSHFSLLFLHRHFQWL